jgi:hypothetical protein
MNTGWKRTPRDAEDVIFADHRHMFETHNGAQESEP